jgi:phospholipid/cholesterol/gamma-HCH transport system substrate-binding protein
MFRLNNETKIGILAVAAICGAIWGFNFLKGINILTASKIFYVKYSNVDQLQPSSPVTINGFQVGRVKNIGIDPEDDRTIVVTLNIDRNVDVPKNTLAIIVGQSVMGGKAIALEFNAPCSGGDCAQSGAFLVGKSKTLIESLIGDPKQIDVYTDRLRVGLTSVYDSIADPNDPQGLGRSLVALERSLRNLETLTKQLNGFMSASAGGITATVNNTAKLTKTISDNDQKINEALSNLATLSKQLTAANLDQTSAKAGVAIDSMTRTISSLRTTLGAAEKTVGDLGTVLQELSSPDGFTGKMLNDAALYDNLVRTTRHTQLLLQDLRLNPKRYNTVKLKIFGKNKTPDYKNPVDDPAYQRLIDSLEREYGKKVGKQ